MLDRKLTEAQAYAQIQRTTYATALEAEVAKNILFITSCREISPIAVRTDARCDLCPAGKQTRSAFASIKHPHETDNSLIRQLAELYTWSPDEAETLVDGIIDGEVHWLGDAPNTPDNAAAWQMLRDFKSQVQTLRSFHTEVEFSSAIKQLRKSVITIVTKFLTNPSETKEKKNLRETAKALLSTNIAHSKDDVGRVAVHLGEIFGFEEPVTSDYPDEARARRGRGNPDRTLHPK